MPARRGTAGSSTMTGEVPSFSPMLASNGPDAAPASAARRHRWRVDGLGGP